MGHRPIPTAPIYDFENQSVGQSNIWLEDVPELERLSADDFIDWYLATVEPEFKEWYLLRQEEQCLPTGKRFRLTERTGTRGCGDS
jgi:hypothetical protein